MSVSASSTAEMARIKQGGKRGAIAAEAAARKEDLNIPDVPKSEGDLQVIGAVPACWAVDTNTHGTLVPMCQIQVAESLRALAFYVQRRQSRITCCLTCCRQLQGARSLTA